MNYKEMYQEIANNHSEHWGGTFQEMMESDKKLDVLRNQYPDLYAKAQADFNEYLRSL
jgi:hypothetical protein